MPSREYIVSGHSVVQKVDQSVAHYARIPESILFDQKLSHCDKLVYAALAFQCFQGRMAIIGQRKISEKLGMSRTQVGTSLRSLAKLGHILRAKERYRGVDAFELTSPVFGQKQGKEDVIEAGPSGVPRYVSLDHEREFGVA